MNTSTREDILANIDTLRESAQLLMDREPQDSDWWHCITIGDKQFDINIYDWETEDGLPLRIATAYPVVHDGSGYGTTNMGSFIRLIEKKGLKT